MTITHLESLLGSSEFFSLYRLGDVLILCKGGLVLSGREVRPWKKDPELWVEDGPLHRKEGSRELWKMCRQHYVLKNMTLTDNYVNREGLMWCDRNSSFVLEKVKIIQPRFH